MLPPAMAMRKFHVQPPELPAEGTPPPIEISEERKRAKSLIGGAIAMRRQHGHASDLGGQFLLDPIFRPEDQEKLRQICSPQDPRPLVVEVGFQLGEFAVAFCQQNPGVRYVGFEVRRKYCQEADALAVKNGIQNAIFCLVDAREMLREVLVPGTLDQLLVFFPDPWWKPRHIKKRLMTPEFVQDAAMWLRPGGRLLLKTDVPGYADWAEAVMRADPNFAIERLANPSADLPQTLRERRCHFHGFATFAIQATRLDLPYVPL